MSETNKDKNWVKYDTFFIHQQNHLLRQSEIPVEHYVSLPLPTRKWLEPAYISFASPVLKNTENPVLQEVPDRWWVIAANGEKIIIYALCSILHFAPNNDFEISQSEPIMTSIAELQMSLSNIKELATHLADTFFEGGNGDKEMRQALLESMKEYLPGFLWQQHLAAAPDFFDWLQK